MVEKLERLIEAERILPDHCFAVPGDHSIIDIVHPETGRGGYSNKTLDEIQAESPGAVVMPIAEFCRQKAERQDTPITWHSITKETYHELFECLPPAAYGEQSFLVGEPWDHHAVSGQPRYQACRYYQGNYEASSRPMTKQEFRQLAIRKE